MARRDAGGSGTGFMSKQVAEMYVSHAERLAVVETKIDGLATTSWVYKTVLWMLSIFVGAASVLVAVLRYWK